MEIKTTEFFKNIKSLPPVGSEEFKQLIDWEIDKISGGITVNGVYISGWLYWHLNHWKIRVDDVDKWGNDIRKASLPDLRDNEWIRAEYLEQCKRERKGYLEVGARQSGKDLLNSSILYKQDGCVEIGDCEVGDEIYDDQGELTTIIGKYPQGIRPVYKITLIDGRELMCGLDHNWWVRDNSRRKFFKRTTREMLDDYLMYRESWKNRKNPYTFRYSIPTAQPVNYPKRDLPIDPYLLGLWLGDGSNYYSKITTIDKEISDYIYKYAKNNNLNVTKDGDLTYIINGGDRSKSNKWNNKNTFDLALKELQLYRAKRIPYTYIRSSIDQRMELLKGLMDTDGSCDRSGAIEFSTTDLPLANTFEELCRSLGIVVKRTEKQGSYKKDGKKILGKLVYRFILFTSKPVFKLPRKLANQTSKPKYENLCSIVNIEYSHHDYTTCIEVNNNSHLFLTDGYTITHNSEMEASYFGMNATMFSNTQNVIICGNDNDLSLLKDKVDFGLRNLWEGISIPRLDKTWRLNQIRLGYKNPEGDDEIWSYIIIRNARDGNVTEVAAGTTAKTFIMDEVGKYPFASAFKAGKPAIKGKHGFRAVPILVGTGGSFDHGKDAENLYYSPESENFLAIKDEATNQKTGVFISGVYRMEYKKEKTLTEFLREERGMELEDTTELDKIKIHVADKEVAIKEIEKERAASKTNPDRNLYLKQVMYYPLTPQECFMSNTTNIFDIDACKRQQAKLKTHEITGTPVELFIDEGKVKHKFTDKLPISNFPLRPSDSKEAPVVIYEFPIASPPYGLYTAGVDPYRQGQAAYSDSLGSVYIYKRMHTITSEKYQEMIVASYSARPDKKETWDEQARLLIKYYNARTLCENDEYSFIDYMVAKGDARYLEKQPDWIREIVPGTSVKREYGIHRSALPIRNFLHTTYKKYLERVDYEERDEEGSVIYQMQGVNKIFDPLLLEETIRYNDEDNFDRVIAAELAIALSFKLDPVIGAVNDKIDGRVSSLGKKAPANIMFPRGSSMFVNKKRKLFT